MIPFLFCAVITGNIIYLNSS